VDKSIHGDDYRQGDDTQMIGPGPLVTQLVLEFPQQPPGNLMCKANTTDRLFQFTPSALTSSSSLHHYYAQ